jgi:hypothetical protein
MHYDLKKTWIKILLSIPISIIISINFLFIFNNGFETKNLENHFLIYFLIILLLIKDFIISNDFIFLSSGDYLFKEEQKIGIFYQLTGKFLFKTKRNIFKYSILHKIFLFSIIISFFSCTIVYFNAFINQEESNTILAILFYFILSLGFSVISIIYLFYRPVRFFYYIFIEHLTYTVKRKIFGDNILYMNKENNLFIYKNNKLHCEKTPAYFHYFNINQSIENITNEDFEKNIISSQIKGDWYINGNKIEGIDNNSSNEDIRKKIKTMNITKNF